MRLSEVKGERTLDVMAAIVEPCANIVQDSEVRKAMVAGKGKDKTTVAAERLKKVVPLIAVKHRSDALAILSSIEGVTSEEYVAELTMPKLLSDVYELVTDEAFLAFLPSA